MEQRSDAKFYEAEFLALAKKYEVIHATGDIDALKAFVKDQNRISLERLKVSYSITRYSTLAHVEPIPVGSFPLRLAPPAVHCQRTR